MYLPISMIEIYLLIKYNIMDCKGYYHQQKTNTNGEVIFDVTNINEEEE